MPNALLDARLARPRNPCECRPVGNLVAMNPQTLFEAY